MIDNICESFAAVLSILYICTVVNCEAFSGILRGLQTITLLFIVVYCEFRDFHDYLRLRSIEQYCKKINNLNARCLNSSCTKILLHGFWTLYDNARTLGDGSEFDFCFC